MGRRSVPLWCGRALLVLQVSVITRLAWWRARSLVVRVKGRTSEHTACRRLSLRGEGDGCLSRVRVLYAPSSRGRALASTSTACARDSDTFYAVHLRRRRSADWAGVCTARFGCEEVRVAERRGAGAADAAVAASRGRRPSCVLATG
ncbi:hypothetical protein B0H11DRAFT_2007054 [Mycena galericulata]|nr:hypothetical protein B0H11DRAFT_2007054 [Mycena galericulata]